MLNKRFLAVLVALTMLLSFSFAITGSAAPITLVMVESLTSPQRTTVLKDIISRFEALNPDIKIELVSPPLEGADQKIRQMLMNKNDIDIMEVRDWTVLEFSQNGYLLALDDYVDTWSGASTLSPTVPFTGKRAGGKYYMMPYGFYQSMIFYRSDWLAEAGLEVPSTYGELLDAAVKMTDPENGRYGWTLRGISGGASLPIAMTVAALGDKGIITDDNYFLPDGKTTIFSTPEALEAFNMAIRFYNEASPKDAIAWGYPDQCQAFTSGITAFLQQDPEVVAICDELMEPGTWSTMPLVVSDKTGQVGLGVGYAGWGISSHSKYPEEAWKFVSFLSDEDNNALFCEKYSVIPIHTNASEKSDFFSSGPFAPYVYMNSNPDKYFFVSGSEKYAENQEFGLAAEPEYQNVLQGYAKAEEVLARWDKYWTEVKAKYSN